MKRKSKTDYILHYTHLNEERSFFHDADMKSAVIQERIRCGTWPTAILVSDSLYERLIEENKEPSGYPFTYRDFKDELLVRGIPVFLFKEYENKKKLPIREVGYKDPTRKELSLGYR